VDCSAGQATSRIAPGRTWSEIDVPVDPSVPWPDQLQGGLESLIGVLRAHPAAPQLLLEHEKRNEPALRATEAALEILRSAGFDAQHASEIARSTLWTGIMLVMSESGYHPELSQDERAEWQRRSQVELAMLPAAKYPRLVECAAPMADCDPDSTTGSASSCSSPASRPWPTS
jgi:TetR/AcrR family tetracycline transcriptional repressor